MEFAQCDALRAALGARDLSRCGGANKKDSGVFKANFILDADAAGTSRSQTPLI